MLAAPTSWIVTPSDFNNIEVAPYKDTTPVLVIEKVLLPNSATSIVRVVAVNVISGIPCKVLAAVHLAN